MTGMRLADVVSHSPRQLEMIYDAHVRERAAEKLMELDNLAVVMTAAFGGKSGPLQAVVARLQKQLDGTAQKPQDQSANRKNILNRLRTLGATLKQ